MQQITALLQAIWEVLTNLTTLASDCTETFNKMKAALPGLSDEDETLRATVPFRLEGIVIWKKSNYSWTFQLYPICYIARWRRGDSQNRVSGKDFGHSCKVVVSPAIGRAKMVSDSLATWDSSKKRWTMRAIFIELPGLSKLVRKRAGEDLDEQLNPELFNESLSSNVDISPDEG